MKLKNKYWVPGIFCLLIAIGLVFYFKIPRYLALDFEMSDQDLFQFFWREKVIADHIDLPDSISGFQRSILDNSVLFSAEPYSVAVMIENHPDSRSQMKGLAKASIVYEALVEGGITRFMGIFSYQDLSEVGPVRSARPYFVRIAEEYDSGYAHAGGSNKALNLIANSNLVNLEGLYYEEFDRSFFRNRKYYAPHNLFARLPDVQLIMDKKLSEKKDLQGRFVFGNLPEGVNFLEASKISINFSYPQFGVLFEYDPSTNLYKRFLAGKAHIDHSDESQIAASNIIIMEVPKRVIDNEGRLAYDLLGEGEALLFRNGKNLSGRWKKESFDEKTLFFDLNEDQFILSSGQIWIALVDDMERVQY